MTVEKRTFERSILFKMDDIETCTKREHRINEGASCALFEQRNRFPKLKTRSSRQWSIDCLILRQRKYREDLEDSPSSTDVDECLTAQ